MSHYQHIKVVFIGSDNFAIPIFLEILKHFTVSAVITEIDKPAGRHQEIQPPPLKPVVKSLSIPCWQPLTLTKNPKLLDDLKKIAPDVIITAAYGKIIPSAILNLPPHGCLNIHPSLLPKYRGASPIQTALLNGDTLTGSSIILMDESLDGGDIVAQEAIEILPEDNYSELSRKLSLLSASLLIKTLPNYLKQTLKLLSQDDISATYTHKIKKEDARINWREPAEKINNKIRAYSDWPVAHTFFQNQKIDLIEAEVMSLNGTKSPGEIFRQDEYIGVACGVDAIRLLKIKPAGKSVMTARDYSHGHPNFIGSILGR